MTSHLKFKNFQFWPIRKPLHIAGVFAIAVLFLLSACGSFVIPTKSSKKSDLASGYNAMSSEDYVEHLAALKKPFLQSPGIKIHKLNPVSQKYLEGLVSDIIGNNEIFFKRLKKGNVTVLDSDSPLHFSLPKGEIFLSHGLITKYIKNESMLVCVLSFELVRSEKLLYPRQTIVPTGYFSLERMLNLNRLGLEEKMEVHKWAHHLTVRSGFDGEYYLSWLQSQNRNTADFILQVGDANQITREESLFKAFLIKSTGEDVVVARNKSSKNFYNFINRIRDIL